MGRRGTPGTRCLARLVMSVKFWVHLRGSSREWLNETVNINLWPTHALTHTHTCTCTCMHVCTHTCERAHMHTATMYTHTNGNIKKECLKQPCVQKELVKDLSLKWRRRHSVIKGAEGCVVCMLMVGTPVAWWRQGYPGHTTRTGWSDCNNTQPRWLSTLVSSRSLARSPVTI